MFRRTIRIATLFTGIFLVGLIVSSQSYFLELAGGPMLIRAGPAGIDAFWFTSSPPRGWHARMVTVEFVHLRWLDYFYMPFIMWNSVTRIGVGVPWWLILAVGAIATAMVWRLTPRRRKAAAFPVEAAASK